MTDLELAWMAGVFEGEGSVRINKPTARNVGAMLVDIPNTDATLVDPFACFGGSIAWYPARERRQAHYRIRVCANQAAQLLQAIQPFIRSERVRAKITLALEFQAQKRLGAGRSDAGYIARQWAYYERMKLLNVRGVTALDVRTPLPESTRRYRVVPYAGARGAARG